MVSVTAVHSTLLTTNPMKENFKQTPLLSPKEEKGKNRCSIFVFFLELRCHVTQRLTIIQPRSHPPLRSPEKEQKAMLTSLLHRLEDLMIQPRLQTRSHASCLALNE